MTSAKDDHSSLKKLRVQGVPGVLSVSTRSDGSAEVTFAESPSPDVIAQVRDLLAPATVRTVWYEGSYSTDIDQSAGTEDDDNLDAVGSVHDSASRTCGVCGTAPAPWPHTAETPAGAAIAAAHHWDLCEQCHARVVSGDIPSLVERFALPDLSPDQLLELARRIH